MTVIDGPGGPITAAPPRSTTRGVDEDALAGLLAYSPQARQVVLEELTARLRQADLDRASGWSHGVADELLD